MEMPEGVPMVFALSAADLVEATCGGSCSCATCQVYVDPQWMSALPAPSDEEMTLIGGLLISRPNSRLACQITMTPDLDGMSLTVAPEQ